MHIVIVTGLSGAGKSTALRALEDYGFYCVDNMPWPMIGELVAWMAQRGDAGEAADTVQRLAVAVGARQARYLERFGEEVEALRALGHQVDVMFLDADEEQLVRRFSATRRRHPLSADDLVAGIRKNRELLADLRHLSHVIDTNTLSVHQLKGLIQDRYGQRGTNLALMLLSFGFKYGLPRESNLVFDVRFLANPYFEPALTDRDGRDPAVAHYVLGTAEGAQMLEHIERMLMFTLPLFERERKLYLTVAVGCTGGRHRSVAIIEELRQRVAETWDVVVKHRDLDVRT